MRAVAIDRGPMTNLNSKLKPSSLTCIAHRGGRLLGTENTLATIEKALELGVDAIEIDAWQVGEHVIVTHDRLLGRVVKGKGRLLDINPKDILKLQHTDDSSVATLNEVIGLVANRARLNVEIKGPGCAPAVANTINQAVSNGVSANENYIVSSFDHKQLHWLLKNEPHILRGCLTYGIPHDGINCCRELKAYSYHPSVDFIDKELVKQAKDLDMEVWAYTANLTEDFEDLLAAGVTGAFTDDPEKLISFNRSNNN